MCSKREEGERRCEWERRRDEREGSGKVIDRRRLYARSERERGREKEGEGEYEKDSNTNTNTRHYLTFTSNSFTISSALSLSPSPSLGRYKKENKLRISSSGGAVTRFGLPNRRSV